jgi:hypothetical protein
MSSKAIYTTTHAGVTETRTSAGHREAKYKFAAWVQVKDGSWHCRSFNSRSDLAHKEIARANPSYYLATAVVPVTCEIKTVKAKPIVAFPGTEFERSGIKFVPDAKWPTSRVGEYRGYKISLRCTGTSFAAYGQLPEEPGLHARSSIGAPCGGLDSRVEKVKAAIDAALAEKAA